MSTFDYDKNPTTLLGLLSSARAQAAAMSHPDYDPRIHGVMLHPLAVVELCEQLVR